MATLPNGMLTTVKKLSNVAPDGSPLGSNNIQMKESFSDVIYNLSPTDTPFTSMCKRESINAIEFGWFADKLADATVPKGIPEGADVPPGTYEEVKRVMNLTQIFMKSVMVSNTAESVDFYGRKSEMAYQMTKKSQELKRDIEATLCGKARQAVGGFWSTLVPPSVDTVPAGTAITDNTTSVREMSNFKFQIINNPFKTAAVAANPPTVPVAIPADNRTVVSGLGAPVSEDMLNKLMQAQWKHGGSAKTALVTASMANSIAKMALTGNGATGSAARYRDIGNEKKLVNVVDIYVTPFGEMKIGLNRWLNYDETAANLKNDIFLIDPKYIALPYLRQPNTKNVPIVGDREQKLITCELSFKLTAPDGCGLLTDVLPAAGVTELSDEPAAEGASASAARAPTVPRRITQ